MVWIEKAMDEKNPKGFQALDLCFALIYVEKGRRMLRYESFPATIWQRDNVELYSINLL